MKVLFTDFDMLDISLEREIFREAGIELVEGQCRSEEDVIRMSEGCRALLVQYAPIGGAGFRALAGYGAAGGRAGTWPTPARPTASPKGTGRPCPGGG